MGDHKNYRFYACHGALILKKQLFAGFEMEKLVFVTVLIYYFKLRSGEHPDLIIRVSLIILNKYKHKKNCSVIFSIVPDLYIKKIISAFYVSLLDLIGVLIKKSSLLLDER